MKIIIKLSFLILPIFLIGCSSMKVEPISSKYKMSHVCIENNPRVIVGGFVKVIKDRFDYHGIDTERYTPPKPKHCTFKLTYTALRSWDFTPYLSHAEMRLYKQNERIGYAEYHLIGKGGFDLSKWKSVKSKMTPVIDKLLEEYSLSDE